MIKVSIDVVVPEQHHLNEISKSAIFPSAKDEP
jgi:hypothetical protein